MKHHRSYGAIITPEEGSSCQPTIVQKYEKHSKKCLSSLAHPRASFETFSIQKKVKIKIQARYRFYSQFMSNLKTVNARFLRCFLKIIGKRMHDDCKTLSHSWPTLRICLPFGCIELPYKYIFTFKSCD